MIAGASAVLNSRSGYVGADEKMSYLIVKGLGHWSALFFILDRLIREPTPSSSHCVIQWANERFLSETARAFTCASYPRGLVNINFRSARSGRNLQVYLSICAIYPLVVCQNVGFSLSSHYRSY